MANFLSAVNVSRILKDLHLGQGMLSTEIVDRFSKAKAAGIFLLAGGLLGWFAWGTSPDLWRMPALLFFPVLWGSAGSRLSASLMVLGYYLMSARGLPGGAAVFFGDGAPWWMGSMLWASACLLLTVPFVGLWTPNGAMRPLRFAMAICVSVVPPFGLIGWVNPLAIAGVLFPGFGWVGLALALGLMSMLVSRSGKWIVGLLAMSIMANLISMNVVNALSSNWLGVDTRFSKMSSGGSDDAGQLLAAMKRIEWVKQFAKTVPANSVRVLPETVLGPYGAVTEFALLEVNADLNKRGSRVLVGAELPALDGRYKNSVINLGAGDGEDKAATQGIPVPVSMWKPWASDGAVAKIWGNDAVVKIRNKRVGVLICYEQLLTFSILSMWMEKPELVVAVSNVWWARGTSIPAIQWQMVNVFGRLFGVEVVESRNW